MFSILFYISLSFSLVLSPSSLAFSLISLAPHSHSRSSLFIQLLYLICSYLSFAPLPLLSRFLSCSSLSPLRSPPSFILSCSLWLLSLSSLAPLRLLSRFLLVEVAPEAETETVKNCVETESDRIGDRRSPGNVASSVKVRSSAKTGSRKFPKKSTLTLSEEKKSFQKEN